MTAAELLGRVAVYRDTRDWWVGAFLDRAGGRVFVCPLPTVVFRWEPPVSVPVAVIQDVLTRWQRRVDELREDANLPAHALVAKVTADTLESAMGELAEAVNCHG